MSVFTDNLTGTDVVDLIARIQSVQAAQRGTAIEAIKAENTKAEGKAAAEEKKNRGNKKTKEAEPEA